jgi:hypothetical protein
MKPVHWVNLLLLVGLFALAAPTFAQLPELYPAHFGAGGHYGWVGRRRELAVDPGVPGRLVRLRPARSEAADPRARGRPGLRSSLIPSGGFTADASPVARAGSFL